MNNVIRAKLPSKFKILEHEKAKEYYYDDEKWEAMPLPQKRMVMKSMFFWDIGLFAWKVTRKWTTAKKGNKRYPIPDFHRDLWKVCLEGNDVVIIVPRGFSKTTAVSRILTLWLLLFELEPSILLVSSKGLGEEIIGDIKRELEENENIKRLWGVLVPIEKRTNEVKKKWRQDELQLLNGMEIKTVTKGQSIRGRRPTLILIDDPEEDKDIKNPRIADEFFHWIFTTLHNALAEDGRMIVLGTIIGEICAVNRLKNEASQRDFHAIQHPAIIDFDFDVWKETKDWGKATKNARPLWPDKWSLDKLHDKLKKIQEKPFMQEFMNIPFIVNATPVFTGTKLDVKEPVHVDGGWSYYVDMSNKNEKEEVDLLHEGILGIDIANGSQSGDYSVIVVRDPQMKLLAQFRAKVSQDALAVETDRIVQQLKGCFIVPENNIGLAYINACKQYEWFTYMYKKTSYDSITMKESNIIGWNTNAKTKVLMISEYHQILREGLEVSPEIALEIGKYFYDEKGSTNAIAPYHDDTIIADALAIQGCKRGIPAPLFTVF